MVIGLEFDFLPPFRLIVWGLGLCVNFTYPGGSPSNVWLNIPIFADIRGHWQIKQSILCFFSFFS